MISLTIVNVPFLHFWSPVECKKIVRKYCLIGLNKETNRGIWDLNPDFFILLTEVYKLCEHTYF